MVFSHRVNWEATFYYLFGSATIFEDLFAFYWPGFCEVDLQV